MAEKQTPIADVVLRGIMVGGGLIMLFVLTAMVLAPLAKVGRQPTKAERWREGRLDGRQRKVARSHTSNQHVKIGEVAVIRVDTCGGTTAGSHDRMTQLLAAKDFRGVGQMVLRGEVVMLKQGTRVRKIGWGLFSNEVRVLDGPVTGRACFVAREFLAPASGNGSANAGVTSGRRN